MSSDVTKVLLTGAKFVSEKRTIGEGDFTMLHNIAWIKSKLHNDKEYMKTTEFGERIMAGALVMAVMSGLAGSTGYQRVVEETGLVTVGLLGYEDVRFKAPLQPGDTVGVETEILDVRNSSKPDRVILKVRDTVFNQRHALVAQATRVYLAQRKA